MWKTIKRIAGGFVLLLIALIAVLAFNTYRFTPDTPQDVASFDLGADTDAAAQILSDALKIETVSTNIFTPAFPQFVRFLETSYPKVHQALEREVLFANTPLFKWEGTNPDLKPVLLAAHYDVVPVATGSLDRWTYPPLCRHHCGWLCLGARYIGRQRGVDRLDVCHRTPDRHRLSA